MQMENGEEISAQRGLCQINAQMVKQRNHQWAHWAFYSSAEQTIIACP